MTHWLYLLMSWYVFSTEVVTPSHTFISLGDDHPYHVSATEMEYNSENNSLEISSRIFTDDLEDALQKKYGIKISLMKQSDLSQANKSIADYVIHHLRISVNNKAVKLDYLGFEIERDAVYVYLEANKVDKVGQIKVENSLLYDLFDDQINIMHIKSQGKRYSDKVSFPDKMVQHIF